MNKVSISAIALAIGLSFGAGAMAQTTQPRGTNKEQPSVQKPAPPTAAAGERKSNRVINEEYNTALRACKSMARADRSKCRADARAQRTADRAQMRTARAGAMDAKSSAKIEQGK